MSRAENRASRGNKNPVTGILGRRFRQGVLQGKFLWYRDKDHGAPVGLTGIRVGAPASLIIIFVFCE